MYKVGVLKNPTKKSWQEINNLIPQLGLSLRKPKPLNYIQFKQYLKQKDVFCVVVKDKNKNSSIIGTATVYLVLLPTGLIAIVEDVIVDENYRGQGIGKILTKELINISKKKKAKHLSVRTNPVRKIANKMYLRMGFKEMETNFYRINF